MMDIQRVNLASFDLNLLRVLDALFLERSVSRAAARLKLSQPATSNALARLRDALEDPLFVRSREGMAPTPRALALRGPLSAALRQVQEALTEPLPFEPATASRTFVLAASDHAQLVVLPQLAKQWVRYPGVKLRVVPLPRDFPTAELESGAVDLVLGVFDLAPGDRAPRSLKRQLLVEERFVLVGRKGHPALRRPEGVDLRLPQLHVAPRGGSESAYDRRSKLQRNVVLYTPHYLVAPWVLSSTELFAALPERVARRFAEAFPLDVVPVKRPHPPLRIQQLWHPLRQGEPAHRWLREQVLAAARRA
ncbi:LysR family transcriptional regulator [Aggregicoccus sp. 17bor-14]|uniref:LysR family transcriptional regulator n=1 Tax=Myxococcaceae TaxID=31 RepID=UPI00129C6A21|nr:MULTISPECIES: LysR family transcriptional regulator [Myxococcaceae]MBF5044558.1 LysR family transcriptional regulator [Simulacricoccus sp. 17bor-14]MRI90303.1 LysR family transcriptional regulator [Aggregicoccus sp. 17bor-14]